MMQFRAEIEQWIQQQQKLIPAKIKNAQENSQDALSNKIISKQTSYLSTLSEVAITEQTFITQMQLLQTTIENAIAIEKSHLFKNKIKIAKLESYLEKIKPLTNAQTNLRLFSCYDDKNLADTERNIYNWILSSEFQNYIDTLINIAVEFNEIQPTLSEIEPPCNEGTQAVFDTKPVALAASSIQRITRYKDLVEAISKSSEKLAASTNNSNLNSNVSSQAQEHLANYATVYNNRLGYLAEMKRAHEEMDAQANVRYPLYKNKDKNQEFQRAALKKIIDLKINTHLNKNHHYRGYVETLLVRAYPELFIMTDRSFDINTKFQKRTFNGLEVDYTLFYKALGYPLNTKEPIQFDPKRLNVQILASLYQSTKNPLWLVLKSTKPIDETFSPNDKVNTYRDLALACINREVSSGDEKYEVAITLANSAYAVAAEHPDAVVAARDGFTPTQTYQCKNKTLDKEQLKAYYENDAKSLKRFGWWVVNKYPTDTKLKQLLDAPYLDGHIKTVESLNQTVELLSQQSRSRSDESITSQTTSDSHSSISSDSDNELELTPSDPNLQQQLNSHTQQELNELKEKILALEFALATSRAAKNRLEQEVNNLTEYSNQFANEFDKLEAVVQTCEQSKSITPPSTQENEGVMDYLIRRVEHLLSLLHKPNKPKTVSCATDVSDIDRYDTHNHVPIFKPEESIYNPLVSSLSRSKPETSSVSTQHEILLDTQDDVSSLSFVAIKEAFTQKFARTNSSGIHKIIDLMNHMTGQNNDVALGIVLMNMQQISQERVDRTLSKIGLFGGGRRREAQEFYDMMKKVDLKTAEGLNQALENLSRFVGIEHNNQSLVL